MEKTDWRAALGALLPDDYVPEPEPEAPAAPLPRLKVRIERRKAGKIVTIIEGFDPDDARAANTAAMLKRKLAAGGSTADGIILIQGDRKNDAIDLLKQNGFKVS